ncbi:CRISPR-associated protein Csx16 [Caviibacterium pharyngocola]|uniref:CRISPR-associated protein Csx16 n=1 Tax=Caviibacterium pharyngocola TaxID=28159 RepID=A0A2M8RU60_9PAST|nr:CRISPR-associated protein Csx16 [Caviibacterium pharyngocola]PJG82414.1 CRISPR-associated protein Csx16 [Caviibacterium pharyngocola]
MTTWFISRHQGAIDWVKQQPIQIDRFESHLNVEDIQADDTVIGTLPIHLAAQVCAKGAKFYFLSVNLRAEQRGIELTADEMAALQCTIEPFYIQKL